jgi:DNA-binding protein YbaB
MVNNSDVLRAKVTAARQKADDAKASLASNKSENAVLSTLTKLKTQGRLKGFHVSCEPSLLASDNLADLVLACRVDWAIWV